MTSGLLMTIIIMSGIIIITLILALTYSLNLLLTELNDPNPNAALTALLGSVTQALGGSLLVVTGAFAAIIAAIAFIWRREGPPGAGTPVAAGAGP